MKEYKAHLLSVKKIGLRKADNPIIFVVLDGSLTVRVFNSIKTYNRQDVFFINSDNIYTIYGQGVLAKIDILTKGLSDIELINALDSIDFKKDITRTYRDCIFIKNLLSLFDNNLHFSEVLESLNSDYNLINNYRHHFLAKTSKQQKIYFSLVELVKEKYSQKLSLSSIANGLNVQKNWLANYFKEISGMTVLEYINLIRLNKAIELMLLMNKSNDEIIESCGFSDRKYFYRYFKEAFNLSPNAYKASMKEFYQDDYTIIKDKEALNKMQDELQHLSSDTHFYSQYSLFKELVKINNYNSFKINVDVFDMSNYLYIGNDKTNSWYGFELIQKLNSIYLRPLKIVFKIDGDISQEMIDEVINLLDISYQTNENKTTKMWSFEICINDISELPLLNYTHKRLSSIFKDYSIELSIL